MLILKLIMLRLKTGIKSFLVIKLASVAKILNTLSHIIPILKIFNKQVRILKFIVFK